MDKIGTVALLKQAVNICKLMIDYSRFVNTMQNNRFQTLSIVALRFAKL